MTHKLQNQPYSTLKDDKPSYKQLEQECKDRADCEKSLTNWNIEVGDKVDKLEKENAELRGVVEQVLPIIQVIYSADYGSQISDDLFNVLQILES